jgi:glucose/arabinose dehydrogenase
MNNLRHRFPFRPNGRLSAGILAVISVFLAAFHSIRNEPASPLPAPDADNGGIVLPVGFGAVTVVDSLGNARHLAVHGNGDVYVKLGRLKDGKGIYVLKDTDGNGKADQVTGFGNYGGTGIVLGNGYLYASSDSAVFRYKMNGNVVANPEQPETIAVLPKQRSHAAKSLALDGKGSIYVNVGAPSNACQEKDRVQGSPAMDPCPMLENHGGIWQFDANKTNQEQDDGVRYATGIRNAVALEWNRASNQLYALQHGRDMLSQLFPALYDDEQSAELPAEEFLLVRKGADFGWPYCYYDWYQNKKLLNPEYGGDGRKTERCDNKEQPIMAFPGHWAPNDLIFYTGNQFPARYQNGAFVAFHGSWNRAPLKQGGYFVAFVPFGKNGRPSGKYEVFAEGFAGGPEITSPADAKARPVGLAQGPDGSVYITDSVKGKVWRVMYTAKE